MKVSVSFLKAKVTKQEIIKKLDNSSCDMIHIDLTDGIFAGTKNYEIEEILSLFQFVRKPLDIHLMLANPEQEIESLAILKPKFMTIPIEIEDAQKYLKKIKGLGIQCGLSINPETKIEVLEPFLSELDLVLVMGVHPGYGGQEYIEETTTKLKRLKNLREKKEMKFLISLDGGVNNIVKEKVKQDTDILVSGSYICMSEDIEEKIKSLK